MDLEVVIIGGSVGGLSVAHALLRAGCSVNVYERAEKVASAGAVSTTKSFFQTLKCSFNLFCLLRSLSDPTSLNTNYLPLSRTPRQDTKAT
jgi:heterodisulfide reductase subunit A-like polyferredoxin